MVRARRSVTELQNFLFDNRAILNLPNQPRIRQQYRVHPAEPYRPPLGIEIYPGVQAIFTPLIDARVAELLQLRRFADIDRSALLRIVVRLTVAPTVRIDAENEEEQLAIARGLLDALRTHFPVVERRNTPPDIRYTAFAFNSLGEARVRQHDQGLVHFLPFHLLTAETLRALWSNQLYPDFDMTNTLHIFEIRLRDLRRFRQGGNMKGPHLFPRPGGSRSKKDPLDNFFSRLTNNACEKHHSKLIQQECPSYLSHCRGIFSLNLHVQWCGPLSFLIGLYYAQTRDDNPDIALVGRQNTRELIKSCLKDPQCALPDHPLRVFVEAAGTDMPTVLDDLGKWVIEYESGVYRVVVYDEFCRCLYECRGDQWKPRAGIFPEERQWMNTFHNTIVLMLDTTTQHFYAVIHLGVFFHHYLLGKLLEASCDQHRLTDKQKARLDKHFICIPYCGYCHRHVISRWRTHSCTYILCHRCHESFVSEQALNEHVNKKHVVCNFCRRVCYGDECVALHQQRGCAASKPYSYCFNCRRWYLDPRQNPRFREHECYSRYCSACRRDDVIPHRMEVEGYGADLGYHHCPIIPLQAEALNPLLDQTPITLKEEDFVNYVNSSGEAYFAYDMESMLVRLPCRLWDTQVTDLFYHEPNLIVVRQLFVPDRQWIFENTREKSAMDSFYSFLISLPVSARFFAHNSKGYDGRIVYDYLMKQHHYFKNIIWNGAKLMMLQIYRDKQNQATYWRENSNYVTVPLVYENGKKKKLCNRRIRVPVSNDSRSYASNKNAQKPDGEITITFADSLCHFQQPLAKLPRMFGLNTALRKGFFPYHFNIPEFQDYRGPIPDLSYFDVEFKNEKTLQELRDWHASWQGREWVLRDEMIAYGVNDVVILAEALESYYRVCVKDYDIDPLKSLTVASYCFKVFRTYHLKDRTLYNLSTPHEEFARRALHGGRTDVRQRYLKLTNEQIEQGYRIEYIDVQSLYPYVQTAFDFPIGIPTSYVYTEHNQPKTTFLEKFIGFVECDIEPTLPLFHPFLLAKQEGKLMAHLYPLKKVVLTSLEFQRAIQKYGYKCTYVYRVDVYERSKDLFKSYIYANLKRKILAGKCPVSEEEFPTYAKELETLYGYKDLQYSDFQPDDARKIASKVRLNSNWGRLAMRQHFPTCRVLTSSAERVDFFRARNYFNWTVKDHLTLGDQSTIVDYVSHTPTKGINVAAASFVTAAGHCVLYDMACRLGFRVLYCDTDSLVYLHKPGWFVPPTGNKLGDWENELPSDDFITEFVALAPKTYAYKTHKQRFLYHAKGVSGNATADAAFTLDNMRDTVMGAQDKLTAKALHFMYSRHSEEGIRSTVITKHVKGTYEKGLIGADYRTFPYGYPELYQKYFKLKNPINVTRAVPWEEVSSDTLPLWEPLQIYPQSNIAVYAETRQMYNNLSMETDHQGPSTSSTAEAFEEDQSGEHLLQWLIEQDDDIAYSYPGTPS